MDEFECNDCGYEFLAHELAECPECGSDNVELVYVNEGDDDDY